jgi:uncharacterized protein YdgA (DUF945 family)
MKRIVIVVLVMFLVLVAAPWGIGRLAEKRVNDGLDKLLQQAPYLTVVERKWTSGWFRSEQEITFEVFAAWLEAMNPSAGPPADLAVASQADTPVTDAAAEELERRNQSAVPGTDLPVEAPAEPADVPEPVAPPEPAKPIRFTVRNEILHGPVLWPASLGLARVNTKLVLGEEIRAQLVRFFGTDEPARISSRVGFFGGGSTRFFGEGRTVEITGPKSEQKADQESGKPDATLVYDDFELEIGYSGDFDEADMDGSWSKLEYTDRASGESMLIKGMSLDGDSERILGDVYDTDFEFEIDEMRFVGADKMETLVEDVHYVLDTEHDDGFVDLSARFGSGNVSNPALTEMELDLREVHYDFTARHLHVETLQKLLESLKAAYAQPVATVAQVDAAVLTPIQVHGIALLKYDPQFVIDRIGVVTADGNGVIKGVVRMVDVTEADLAAGFMALVGKIVADVSIEVGQKLLEKIPNGATGAGMAVDQGFAKREGDKLVSHIEYSNGELKVNGKPLPIPGLGAAPPPQDGYPSEEPPPQE